MFQLSKTWRTLNASIYISITTAAFWLLMLAGRSVVFCVRMNGRVQYNVKQRCIWLADCTTLTFDITRNSHNVVKTMSSSTFIGSKHIVNQPSLELNLPPYPWVWYNLQTLPHQYGYNVWLISVTVCGSVLVPVCSRTYMAYW